MESPVKALGITIKGRVQGVFFRKYTQESAMKIGISGFVRNLENGAVFIWAEGTESQLDELVTWCHFGSPLSKVLEVKVEAFDPKNINGFEIRR